jgi:membrane protease YdiL (CAAX protease family)
MMQAPINNQEEHQLHSPFVNRFLTKGFLSGKNEWWMYLLGILSAFTGYSIYASIVSQPLSQLAMQNGVLLEDIKKNLNIIFNPEKVGINSSLMLMIMMGMFVFAIFFFWMAVKFIHKKMLKSIITSSSNIRWKRYFFSFSNWTSLILLNTVVSYFLFPKDMEFNFDINKFISLFVVVIIFIPIQTATEELIFRGYLMQGLGIAFKNGIVPFIITSVLFGLMHGSNPEAKAHGLLIMMPYYIFFGAFLGFLTLLDEGMELALGIHCANNLISCLLITSKNSVLQTDALFYVIEKPVFEFLCWIIMASICFFILYKKYKLSNWKLLIR